MAEGNFSEPRIVKPKGEAAQAEQSTAVDIELGTEYELNSDKFTGDAARESLSLVDEDSSEIVRVDEAELSAAESPIDVAMMTPASSEPVSEELTLEEVEDSTAVTEVASSKPVSAEGPTELTRPDQVPLGDRETRILGTPTRIETPTRIIDTGATLKLERPTRITTGAETVKLAPIRERGTVQLVPLSERATTDYTPHGDTLLMTPGAKKLSERPTFESSVAKRLARGKEFTTPEEAQMTSQAVRESVKYNMSTVDAAKLRKAREDGDQEKIDSYVEQLQTMAEQWLAELGVSLDTMTDQDIDTLLNYGDLNINNARARYQNSQVDYITLERNATLLSMLGNKLKKSPNELLKRRVNTAFEQYARYLITISAAEPKPAAAVA